MAICLTETRLKITKTVRLLPSRAKVQLKRVAEEKGEVRLVYSFGQTESTFL